MFHCPLYKRGILNECIWYKIQIIIQKVLNGTSKNIHLDSFMYNLILLLKLANIYLKDAVFKIQLYEIYFLLSDIHQMHALTTFPKFTFALAGFLQSFHRSHAQLSSPNGKFVFSGTFHLMWVEVRHGISL